MSSNTPGTLLSSAEACGKRRQKPVNSSHPGVRAGDIAALLRLLVEATDRPAFLDRLHSLLPQLLPQTRIDLLVDVRPGVSDVLLSCGGTDDPAPPERMATGFVGWLSEQGYGSISTLPLPDAYQRRGWLVIARRDQPINADLLALAGQLAAMIALRLMYDEARTALEEREEQALLLEQRLRATEEVRLRATLAAGAAHDIGNLFASVMGHVQLLQQQALPSYQNDLRTIEQAARDGHYLLRRVLTTRLPLVMPSTSPVALMPTIINDALKLTQPFWIERPAISVRSALVPVPPVRAHAAELREVLINLIMNGLTAMPEGGTLTLRTYATAERVLVDVSDTGIGIAKAHQNTIFQPMTSSYENGTGLGLSVSRAILEGYGGTLTVESTPGQGATFTLALPVADGTPPSTDRR